MSTVVAKIDKDYIDDSRDTYAASKEFHYEAMENWWGWGRTRDDGLPTEEELLSKPHTRFRLYDDDGDLYYEGWLYNDDQAFVQQFVLAWAESDSGCTTIKVRKPDLTWAQEIG